MKELRTDLDYYNKKIAQIKLTMKVVIMATNASYGKFGQKSLYKHHKVLAKTITANNGEIKND